MSENRKMNAILVLADQHHANVMGCAGHPQAITPNLDAFAKDGVRFSSAYCQNPICTPSRVSWLSGQYCHNHGSYGLSGPAWFALPSMFRHFRNNGYRTAGLGKLHLPHQPRNWVADDLDLYEDTYSPKDGGDYGRTAYMKYLEDLGLRELDDSWHNPWMGSHKMDARPSELPYEHTMERWITDRTIDFIDDAPEQPFFIEIAYQRPHHPLLPQPQFWDLYPPDLELPDTFDHEPAGRPPHFRRVWERTRDHKGAYGAPNEGTRDWARRAWRGTLACVSQMDDVFGRLVQALRDRGLYDNTVIVYSSDHGGYHTIHGMPEKAPGICSDAVCRIPMLWRVPDVTEAGHVSDQLVETVDAAPTLCAVCGIPPMETTDGKDVSALLRGGTDPVRDVAVTENPWSKSMRWGRWRFVHYQREMWAGRDVGELYDLEADPGERNNLYDDPEHRETVEACRRMLLEWLIDTQRCRTVHPPRQGIDVQPDGTIRPQKYETAADGKESNLAGPRQRLEDGRTQYL